MDRVIALKAPSVAAPPADGVARPKVMRRPAHFSDAAPATNVQPFSAPELIAREKPAPVSKSWQDDGRFAVALLAIVILTNLAVMAWLNHIGPHTKAGTSAPVLAAAPPKENAAPTLGDITVFAQPGPTDDAAPLDDDSAAPTIHLLDDGAATVEQ